MAPYREARIVGAARTRHLKAVPSFRWLGSEKFPSLVRSKFINFVFPESVLTMGEANLQYREFPGALDDSGLFTNQ